MPVLTVGDLRLYYEVHGQGPWLVLAHGAAGNHLSWWQQVPVFAKRYRCVIFDHRGFGLSRNGEGEVEPARFVDDLGALLDHLGAQEVRLVGQSMGGLTCMGFALRHPERVRALVMASTLAGMRRPAWRAASEEVRAYTLRLWERRRQGVRRALSPSFARAHPHLAFLYRQIAALNPPRPPDLPRRYPIIAQDPADLARLVMPVLFIVGEEDDLFPPPLVEVGVQLLPNARLLVVPGAGHSVYYERPDVFNRAVLEFLAEVEGA
jgi:3-oxoadipate enol-lactonase